MAAATRANPRRAASDYLIDCSAVDLSPGMLYVGLRPVFSPRMKSGMFAGVDHRASLGLLERLC